MDGAGETFDSVYPDLLRTGIAKLAQVDARRELLALFSALEHMRRDLHEQDSAAGILRVSQRYLGGLALFRSGGFWLVNATDLSFELCLADPETDRARLDGIVTQEIRVGRFAAALRQTAPVFFEVNHPGNPGRGLLHSLAVSSQVVGMFCGILQSELAPNQEIVFSLLSLVLGGSADALATLRKTAKLTDQIKTLSGLLPVCSWCKKVRDDRGYWEQIEKYVSSRTEASFTHGICPDCQRQWIGGLG